MSANSINYILNRERFIQVVNVCILWQNVCFNVSHFFIAQHKEAKIIQVLAIIIGGNSSNNLFSKTK